MSIDVDPPALPVHNMAGIGARTARVQVMNDNASVMSSSSVPSQHRGQSKTEFFPFEGDESLLLSHSRLSCGRFPSLADDPPFSVFDPLPTSPMRYSPTTSRATSEYAFPGPDRSLAVPLDRQSLASVSPSSADMISRSHSAGPTSAPPDEPATKPEPYFPPFDQERNTRHFRLLQTIPPQCTLAHTTTSTSPSTGADPTGVENELPSAPLVVPTISSTSLSPSKTSAFSSHLSPNSCLSAKPDAVQPPKLFAIDTLMWNHDGLADSDSSDAEVSDDASRYSNMSYIRRSIPSRVGIRAPSHMGMPPIPSRQNSFEEPPSPPPKPPKDCCIHLSQRPCTALPTTLSEKENAEDPAVPSKAFPNVALSCKRCNSPITRVLVRCKDGILSGVYHPGCFYCTECKLDLREGIFFVYKDAPYCKQHYLDLSQMFCTNCKDGLDGVYRRTAHDTKYHPHCFVCQYTPPNATTSCGKQLDDYFDINDRVYCEMHTHVLFSPYFPSANGKPSLEREASVQSRKRTSELIRRPQGPPV